MRFSNSNNSSHTKTKNPLTTTNKLIQLSDGTCQSDRPQQVVFTERVQHYFLEGPVVMTKLVSSDQECQMACILSMKCDIFNLGPRDESFRYTCQTLRFGVLKHSAQRKQGWSFRARKVGFPLHFFRTEKLLVRSTML